MQQTNCIAHFMVTPRINKNKILADRNGGITWYWYNDKLQTYYYSPYEQVKRKGGDEGIYIIPDQIFLENITAVIKRGENKHIGFIS